MAKTLRYQIIYSQLSNLLPSQASLPGVHLENFLATTREFLNLPPAKYSPKDIVPLSVPNLQEIPWIALIPFKSYRLGGNYACLNGKDNLQRTKLFTMNYNRCSATEHLVRFLICHFENFCPKQKPNVTISVLSQDF